MNHIIAKTRINLNKTELNWINFKAPSEHEDALIDFNIEHTCIFPTKKILIFFNIFECWRVAQEQQK